MFLKLFTQALLVAKEYGRNAFFRVRMGSIAMQ
jgi:hypothetical protein